jgi:hypothetical protein
MGGPLDSVRSYAAFGATVKGFVNGGSPVAQIERPKCTPLKAMRSAIRSE